MSDDHLTREQGPIGFVGNLPLEPLSGAKGLLNGIDPERSCLSPFMGPEPPPTLVCDGSALYFEKEQPFAPVDNYKIRFAIRRRFPSASLVPGQRIDHDVPVR